MPAGKSSRANSAWAGKPAPTRGPKPSLSTDQIARAAIRLADAGGLSTFTMQRLASEVGMTTMALYRYFPSKSDVLAVMIDSATDGAPEFGRPSPWNIRIKEWARRCLRIYRDHPWFLEATTVRRSPMGPNELSWMEAALAMLAESGLKSKERHNAFLAIMAHVRGHATFEQIRAGSAAGEEWAHELAEMLQSQAKRYRILLEEVRSGAFSQTGEAFDFGLDCLVDGICARVGRRTG